MQFWFDCDVICVPDCLQKSEKRCWNGETKIEIIDFSFGDRKEKGEKKREVFFLLFFSV